METHAASLLDVVRRKWVVRIDAWAIRAVAVLALALRASVGGAQSRPLEARTDLVVEGVSLNDALLTLRRTVGVSIAFSPDILSPTIRVTCRCGRVSVAEALRTLHEGTSLTVPSARAPRCSYLRHRPARLASWPSQEDASPMR